jgi:plastocyanin domain-containing protein
MTPLHPRAFALVLASLSVASLTGCKEQRASARGVGAAMSVNVIANEKGFTPSTFELEKGAPATLIFRRTTEATCATEVVFPELKITKPLPLDVPVLIEVPTGEARTLTFQCGMGMFKGKAVIH